MPITRALGVFPSVLVDLLHLELGDDDALLLCSDGLHNYVGAEEMRGPVRDSSHGGTERLVALANQRGGRDNITCLVLRTGGAVDQQQGSAPAQHVNVLRRCDLFSFCTYRELVQVAAVCQPREVAGLGQAAQGAKRPCDLALHACARGVDALERDVGHLALERILAGGLAQGLGGACHVQDVVRDLEGETESIAVPAEGRDLVGRCPACPSAAAHGRADEGGGLARVDALEALGVGRLARAREVLDLPADHAGAARRLRQLQAERAGQSGVGGAPGDRRCPGVRDRLGRRPDGDDRLTAERVGHLHDRVDVRRPVEVRLDPDEGDEVPTRSRVVGDGAEPGTP